jgi:hypothetical protein
VAWNLVAHQKIDATGIPATGAALVTTGADLLIVIGTENGAAGEFISDSKGNTWHQLTLQDSGPRNALQMVYAWNAIAGTGHTFTVGAGTNSNGSVVVLAFSGSRKTSDPFLVQNGASTGASDTGITIPSITPGVNNALIVTGFSIDDPGGNTIGCSGFIITDTFDVVPGATFGVSGAYAVQANSAPISVVWTRSTTNTQSGDNGVVAAFASADSNLVIPSRSLGPGRHVGSQFNQVVRSPQAYVVPDQAKTLVVPTRPLVRLGRFSFILDHRQNQGIFNPVVISTLPPLRTLMGVGI